MKLVLASSSPRRAELLSRLGLEFEIVPAYIDESRRPDEPPAIYVERLAGEKAASGDRQSLVLAADTAVVHAGKVLGKPAHPAEARTMLARLQGDTHDVFTGVAMSYNDETVSLVDVTEVEMLPMTGEEIVDYVASGEPMDKAGSYALQGRGGKFVSSVSGSPSTVIGLPLHLLDRLATRLGVRLDDFRVG